jgi:hypothetical protein
VQEPRQLVLPGFQIQVRKPGVAVHRSNGTRILPGGQRKGLFNHGISLAAPQQADFSEVRSLGLRRGEASPAALLRLSRWLRRERPDILVTWLYHADLLGILAGRLAGVR